MAVIQPVTAITLQSDMGGNRPINHTVKLSLQRPDGMGPIPYYGSPYTRKYGYRCSALALCSSMLQSILFFSTIVPLLNHPKTCSQTPISPTTVTAQWSIQRSYCTTTYAITHPATSRAPYPCPIEHLLMRVLLNGDIPRATPSREPTGRPRQSHGGCTALKARTSHSLWAWCSQRPYTYLGTPWVTHQAMAKLSQPQQQSWVPQVFHIAHKSPLSASIPMHQ